jgi:hypothetical protein
VAACAASATGCRAPAARSPRPAIRTGPTRARAIARRVIEGAMSNSEDRRPKFVSRTCPLSESVTATLRHGFSTTISQARDGHRPPGQILDPG